MSKLSVFLLFVLISYSSLWFFWPWSPLVALFISGLAFLWTLFFLSFLVLTRGLTVAAGLAALPLALAPLAQPLYLWYALSPLVYLVLLVYAASRIYGWLWGFFFVVGSLWLHLALMALLNWLSGGFVMSALHVGFDVYERWNVPLITALDSSTLYASCVVMRKLFRKRER
ncbi:hypothetical protein [Pyrobaculum aerophilum]|uniref:P. aerophilum family 550 protein n=2 Tax=Pyrobaculum aerophilum TaxID=13773 RepID=Q8ZTG7_PYRAE|nr:hypothetical protein [Pyrobaculum aerophilum]AAL64794.1 P. aerophilum family 550 protein [Pyrobaculum aerophilum str. IM2]RFA94510.1 hypothetical protein CGL51_10000 [Pyrobaculum aerophilum]RFA99282.1 hypothetical protein CGL52_04270 [Pyrobaculum aerophilum]HII47596.1 hypothetical protein [Pyrobaculum aerophilum]